MKIYFIRHAETDWNVQKRFQGHLDIPLNNQGRLQAIDLQNKLKNLNIERVYSSDLSRASETANIAFKNSKLLVTNHHELREVHMGEVQGLTKNEMNEKFGMDMWKKWSSNNTEDLNFSFPGGEKKNYLFTKILKFINEIPKDLKVIAIVTHGGVIKRLMINSLQGEKIPYIGNTSIYEFSYLNNSLKFLNTL